MLIPDSAPTAGRSTPRAAFPARRRACRKTPSAACTRSRATPGHRASRRSTWVWRRRAPRTARGSWSSARAPSSRISAWPSRMQPAPIGPGSPRDSEQTGTRPSEAPRRRRTLPIPT